MKKFFKTSFVLMTSIVYTIFKFYSLISSQDFMTNFCQIYEGNIIFTSLYGKDSV